MNDPDETRIGVDALRAALAAPRAADVWRSLDELDASGAIGPFLAERFPRYAAHYDADRRQFLKLMSASLALAGLAGCTREPQERILPYVDAPLGQVAGEPRFYATAHVVAGVALGVLIESNMGRPTKVEGNPLHPASLGSTDVYAQASVLDLWDPDRAQAVTHRGEPGTWGEFAAALQARMAKLAQRQGDGLRVLTETVTSPTLAAQMQALLARYPRAQWHQYDPVNRDNVYEGTRVAFGQPLDVRHRFDRAQVVLSLDADFLGTGHARVRDARDFVGGHATHGAIATSNRLYAIAATPSLTSAYADHPVALRAGDVEQAARRIARLLGMSVTAPEAVPGMTETWLTACARDLAAHRGASLVVAGDGQPAAVHALAHAMNAALGNAGATVEYADPVVAKPVQQGESLAALVRDMAGRRVDTLLAIGGNPVYCAPRDLAFSSALRNVAMTVRLGLHEDETSARCEWHLPSTHPFEAWSDARAFDGTVTILQPLIAPLYAGRSAHELLSMLVDGVSRSGYAIVREFWQTRLGTDFEPGWERALRDGVVANTAFAARTVTLRNDALAASPVTPRAGPNDTSLELLFVPDASTFDGRYANNAWLQELPRPLTKLTWDNVLLVPPALAARLRLANHDVVEVRHRDASVEAPVWIMPGHADDAVTVSLGYGRTRAGRIGNGVGFDAYALRTGDAPWFTRGVTLTRTGSTYPLATTQHHHSMEGRDLVRVATQAAFARAPKPVGAERERQRTLYAPFTYTGYQWGMSVDLGACIGCNACTIACQAENNIPTVGKEQVARGREMHWIRVDRYYDGLPGAPRTYFQPVPCMQCQRAPCEVVCPVEASIHDSEGINVQVYNRCVGTRFCSNNCPYKVRRFNFLQYSDEETESLKGGRNPQVTVRMRGIMEKCNYCLQRIQNGRIEADKADRRIADGEVVTACQAACPTRAIVFGDLNDPMSAVNARKASPLDYTLLAELNTEPRTTYLAKLTNPNPDVRES
jgi:MoCo/4Fe-4S cofactor protein with predicted Tat translocation signal